MNKSVIAGALLFSVLSATGPAVAEPQGGQVRSGSATIDQTLGTTTIRQLTDKAIIDWHKFNVAPNELVKFVQPSEMAVILNRVTGKDPSLILGKLQANGQLFLVNPNGILFGPQSQVDVGSLVATTLSISNDDFLSGNYHFTQDSNLDLASVVNQGTLHVSDEGYVILTAPLVSNEGMIVANLGKVQIGAGTEMTLNLDGRNLVNYQVHTAQDAGTVALSPAEVSELLHQSAGSLEMVEENGEVRIAAGTAVQAGTVRATGGSATVEGTNAILSGSTTAGEIRALGQNVTVAGDVRGHDVFLGGSARGQGPLKNATTTVVSGDVQVEDGGTIVVWSDQRTEVSGTLTAGANGLVETSSKQDLLLTGTVSAGQAGTWLIDPANLTIIHDTGSTTPGTNEVLDSAINTGLTTGNVTINAETPSIDVPNGGFSASTPGNILLASDADITYTGSTVRLLSLIAGTTDGAIDLQGDITATGNLLIALQAGTSSNGNVSVSGTVQTAYQFASQGGGTFTQTGPAITGFQSLGVDHQGDITINASSSTGDIGLRSFSGDISGQVTGSTAVAIATSDGAITLTSSDVESLAMVGGNLAYSGDLDDLTLAQSASVSAGAITVATASGTFGSGTVAVSAGGNLAVEQVESLTSLDLTSSGGALSESGSDAGVDLTAPTVTLTAAQGIGTGDALEVHAGTTLTTSNSSSTLSTNVVTDAVVATVIASTGGADVSITDAGATTQVSYSGGSLTVNLPGSVKFTNQSDLGISNVTAGTVELVSVAGEIIDVPATGAVDITANSVKLTSFSGVGNSDPLDLATGSLDVLVTDDGSLHLTNDSTGYTNVDASMVIGPGTTGDLSYLQTGPATLNLTEACAQDGTLVISNPGDITITDIAGSTSASITSATGAIFALDNASSPNITAEAVVLTAEDGIGTSADPVTSIHYDVTATQTGDGDIWLESLSVLPNSANLTVASGFTGDISFLITGLDTLTLTASTDAGSVTVETVADLVASVTATSASLKSDSGSITTGVGQTLAADSLVLDAWSGVDVDVATGSLDVTVQDDGNITVDNDASGFVAVDASLVIGPGTTGDLSYTQTGGAVLNLLEGCALDGTLSISSDQVINVTEVTGSTTVSITSTNGAINAQDNMGAPNVEGSDITLSAQHGIGDATRALFLFGDNITATQTSDGDIVLESLNSLPATADLSIASGSSGNISLTSTNFDILAVTASTDNGDVTIDAQDDLYADVTATTASLTVQAGSLLSTGLQVVTADQVTLTSASGIGDNVNRVQTATNDLTATVTGDGDLFVENTSATASNVTVALQTQGAGSLNFDQLGINVALDLNGVIAQNGNIVVNQNLGDLTVTDVEAVTAGTVALTTQLAGDIFVAFVSSPTTVTLSSAETINEVAFYDDDPDVVAPTAVFSANRGIGDDLYFDTDAVSITASTVTGDLVIHSVGAADTTASLTVSNTGTGQIVFGQEHDTANPNVHILTATTPDGDVLLENLTDGALTVDVADGHHVDINTYGPGNITLGSITAVVGASADSYGSILDGNGAALNVTADEINFVAEGTVGTAADPIEVAAANGTTNHAQVLNVETYSTTLGDGVFVDTGISTFDVLAGSSEGGDIDIHGTTSNFLSWTGGVLSALNPDGLVAFRNTSVSAPDIGVGLVVSGGVNLVSQTGALTDANGSFDNLALTLGALLTAAEGIGAGDALEMTGAASIDAYTDNGGIGLSNDTTADTVVTLEVGLAMGDIDYVQTGAAAMQVAFAGTVDGNINLSNDGSVVLDDVEAAAAGNDITVTTTLISSIGVGFVSTPGDITLTTSGKIFEDTPDPDADLVGSAMTLQSVFGIGAADALEIDADGTLIAGASSNGPIRLANLSGPLDVTQATTGLGSIKLSTLNGDLTVHAVTAGGSKNVNLSTFGSGNILLGDVSAVGATVQVNSIGDVQDLGGDADAEVTSKRVRFSSQTGIGAADALELDVESVTAASVAQAGDIRLADLSGGLAVTADTANGAIDLTATGGGLTLNDVSAGGTGKSITATNTGSGDMLVGRIVASGDAITLTSAGAVLESGADPEVDIQTTDLNVTSLGLGAQGATIETQIVRLNAVVGGTGSIILLETDNLQALTATAAGGSVNLRVTAGLLTLGTVSGAVNVTGQTLTLGNILVDDVSAGSLITVGAFGNINQADVDAGPELSTPAGTLSLTAGTGIGTTSDLLFDAATLNASVTGTGGIALTNNASTGLLTVTNATTTNGSISLTGSGGTIRLDNVVAGGAGKSVTVTTTGTGSLQVDLVQAPGAVSLSAGKNITEIGVDPDDDVVAGGNSTLSALTGLLATSDALEVNITGATLSVRAGAVFLGFSIKLNGLVNGSATPTASLIHLNTPPGTSTFNNISF